MASGPIEDRKSVALAFAFGNDQRSKILSRVALGREDVDDNHDTDNVQVLRLSQ